MELSTAIHAINNKGHIKTYIPFRNIFVVAIISHILSSAVCLSVSSAANTTLLS